MWEELKRRDDIVWRRKKVDVQNTQKTTQKDNLQNNAKQAVYLMC